MAGNLAEPSSTLLQCNVPVEETMEDQQSTSGTAEDSNVPEALSDSGTPPNEFFPLVGIEDEYAAQFFGFTTKSFCNEIYNALNSYLVGSLETMSAFLLQQYPSELTEEEVQDDCEKIQQKVTTKMDKAFDKLEIYLDGNLMCIPDHVVLEEDQPHTLSEPTPEEEAEVDAEVKELTNGILALKYANVTLREELKVSEKAQTECEKIQQLFIQLEKDMKQNKVSDLRESLLFTLSQAQKSVEITGTLKALAEQVQTQNKKGAVISGVEAEIDMITRSRRQLENP